MSKYTYDIDSFSDLYKDSYGFRPSAGFYEWLSEASADELQAKWDYLIRVIDANFNEQERQQAEALEDLNRRMAQIMTVNRVSMATAIRWMHDAYDTNGDNEYLDYKLGVKYGTVNGLLQSLTMAA